MNDVLGKSLMTSLEAIQARITVSGGDYQSEDILEYGCNCSGTCYFECTGSSSGECSCGNSCNGCGWRDCATKDDKPLDPLKKEPLKVA